MSNDPSFYPMPKFESQDGYEELRQLELKIIAKAEAKRKKLLKYGHGAYDDVDERQFMKAVRHSNVLIVHFYLPGTERCSTVDRHFEKLAKKHLVARFIRMNMARCPFIADKLGVTVVPTLIAIKGKSVVDKMEGFIELCKCDYFSTEMFEYRLSKSGVLNREEDNPFPVAEAFDNQMAGPSTISTFSSDSDSDSECC